MYELNCPKINKRMLEKHKRKNVYKTYRSGENVFVRIGKKRGKFSKRHIIFEGKILKSYKDDTYKVKYKEHNSNSDEFKIILSEYRSQSKYIYK